MNTCPTCQQVLPEGFKGGFCPQCGNRVARPGRPLSGFAFSAVKASAQGSPATPEATPSVAPPPSTAAPRKESSEDRWDLDEPTPTPSRNSSPSVIPVKPPPSVRPVAEPRSALRAPTNPPAAFGRPAPLSIAASPRSPRDTVAVGFEEIRAQAVPRFDPRAEPEESRDSSVGTQRYDRAAVLEEMERIRNNPPASAPRMASQASPRQTMVGSVPGAAGLASEVPVAAPATPRERKPTPGGQVNPDLRRTLALGEGMAPEVPAPSAVASAPLVKGRTVSFGVDEVQAMLNARTAQPAAPPLKAPAAPPAEASTFDLDFDEGRAVRTVAFDPGATPRAAATPSPAQSPPSVRPAVPKTTLVFQEETRAPEAPVSVVAPAASATVAAPARPVTVRTTLVSHADAFPHEATNKPPEAPAPTPIAARSPRQTARMGSDVAGPRPAPDVTAPRPPRPAPDVTAPRPPRPAPPPLSARERAMIETPPEPMPMAAALGGVTEPLPDAVMPLVREPQRNSSPSDAGAAARVEPPSAVAPPAAPVDLAPPAPHTPTPVVPPPSPSTPVEEARHESASAPLWLGTDVRPSDASAAAPPALQPTPPAAPAVQQFAPAPPVVPAAPSMAVAARPPPDVGSVVGALMLFVAAGLSASADGLTAGVLGFVGFAVVACALGLRAAPAVRGAAQLLLAMPAVAWVFLGAPSLSRLAAFVVTAVLAAAAAAAGLVSAAMRRPREGALALALVTVGAAAAGFVELRGTFLASLGGALGLAGLAVVIGRGAYSLKAPAGAAP